MLSAQREMAKIARGGNGDIDDYRLSGRPFYIKLCESKVKTALDAGMVSGMYVPLGLWRRLLCSPVARGRRGGVMIDWNTCKRRFSNSEFTRLLRHGWIGSAAGRSAFLGSVIEDVLGNGRMLVLAATSDGPASRDFRRDGLGRFAAEDDPAGAF